MIAATGVVSCAAVLTTAAAYAAYGSPSLEASHDGNSVTLDVAQSPGDDATALIRIISPLQTEIAAQPAGTTIGSGSATFVATAAGNTELRADGRLEIVDAGPIDAGALTGCAVGERVVALWRLRLAGQRSRWTCPSICSSEATSSCASRTRARTRKARCSSR